ncbi:phosphoglucose isomerase-like protein [Tamaricihabitans halophyticus]|uniref:Phosphoglucose isomerase-like protein n=1 Tax=Tamaricihabitans halophyticus TaxID=1262583 RepID=A0A4R2QIP6_9PSEU|nr:SIS domain-containing protein [Tamaricihabitans halophyticus]TCP49232.1 phosphoglucose isomerase-like protein [Tamaricihabitans halophyticus]
MFDDALLDDPTGLTEADTEGLLLAVARAGAQVRSTMETAERLGLTAALEGSKPRALVLLGRPGVAPAVHRILAALLGPGCPVPVVCTDVLPSWIGPLDVVLAHADDEGDRELAIFIDRAVRYGATVVLTAPQEGPVAAAAAGGALLLPPVVDVPAGLGAARVLTSGLLTLNALGLLRTDVAALADELDREAERDHLAHESFVNPAKSLTLRLAEHTPLLWGLDAVATATARHAAYVLGEFTETVCDVSDYPQARARTALHRGAVRGGSPESLFADPDLDGPDSRLRVLLLTARSDEATAALRVLASDALPSADVLAPSAEVATELAADEATCAAVLALRFELAALYLGLATGNVGAGLPSGQR